MFLSLSVQSCSCRDSSHWSSSFFLSTFHSVFLRVLVLNGMFFPNQMYLEFTFFNWFKMFPLSYFSVSLPRFKFVSLAISFDSYSYSFYYNVTAVTPWFVCNQVSDYNKSQIESTFSATKAIVNGMAWYFNRCSLSTYSAKRFNTTSFTFLISSSFSFAFVTYCCLSLYMSNAFAKHYKVLASIDK